MFEYMMSEEIEKVNKMYSRGMLLGKEYRNKIRFISTKYSIVNNPIEGKLTFYKLYNKITKVEHFMRTMRMENTSDAQTTSMLFINNDEFMESLFGEKEITALTKEATYYVLDELFSVDCDGNILMTYKQARELAEYEN